MSCIKLVKNKYSHYVAGETEVRCLQNDESINYNLQIVYFINCLCNNNWFSWLYNQLKLVEYMSSPIHVVATLRKEQETEFREKAFQFQQVVSVDCYYEDEFEYRGIQKIWQLSQIHNKSNDILLYFHSKGVTHFPSYEHNRNDDYNVILKDIDLIKEIFTLFPKIDKVGFITGGIGWIWYNFWYTRGSYLSQVEMPVKTNRRHYYEDYLSRKVTCDEDKYCDYERPITFYENTLNTCYGIYSDRVNIKNIGMYYNPEDRKFYDV